MLGRRIAPSLWTLLLILAAACPAAAADGPAKTSPRLQRALAGNEAVDEDGRIRVWVRFTDKNPAGAALDAALADAARDLAPAARQRRERMAVFAAVPVDQADLPVTDSYLAGVAATGAVHRRTSRWLNAASFAVEPDRLTVIAALPYVAGVDLVGSLRSAHRRPARSELLATAIPGAAPADKSLDALDYGFSADQLEQINVQPLHAAGLSGQGVVIAIFDTGFELNHESLHDVPVLAAWDFVDEDPVVSPEEGDDITIADHGSQVLSLIMGFSRGNLIGPAYGASAILARTEDISGETVAEEDNWIAALEWAEGLGADLVSSAVGYYEWYEFADMDGRTAAITVAAELAAARGLCVVNSVGNENFNPYWGHLIPPADGPSVVAVGSVDTDGFVNGTSSRGPTADGRIKPDVMAQGEKVVAALPWVEGVYTQYEGADQAAAQVAGVVALMLERSPGLTPRQVSDALRASANRATLPDNDYGWGVIDALAAVEYWTPSIDHTPYVDTEDPTDLEFTAIISSRLPLDPAALSLAWRQEGETWRLEGFTHQADSTYTAVIPPQSYGTRIEYYLVAGNELGLSTTAPGTAPAEVYAFSVGHDTEPPVVHHHRLTDQTAATWPPTVVARVTDNTGLDRVQIIYQVGGVAQGPYDLIPAGDNSYVLELPPAPVVLLPGQEVIYGLYAWDSSTAGNLTVAGPFSTPIVLTRGRVLMINDRVGTKASAAAAAAWDLRPQAPVDKSTGADLALWLQEDGWWVDVVAAEEVTLDSFLGYDAVFMTTGRNGAPLAYPALREGLLNWNRVGGRMLIEGGELAYASELAPDLAPIRTEILRIEGWASDDGRDLTIPPAVADHPFQHRPNELPARFQAGPNDLYAYSYADVVWPREELDVLYRTYYGDALGGVLAFDDNTGRERGQTVYLSFDLGQLNDATGRALLENAMNYLTGSEEPGPSQLAGRVVLAGRTDHSGVLVRCGQDHMAVTGADGAYAFAGLWGGSYAITAEAAGFAPGYRQRDLVDGQLLDDVDFYLEPAVPVTRQAVADQPIPDNDPQGISNTIFVVEQARLGDIAVQIDISHSSIGNLVVKLTSPEGTTVTLSNRSGGLDDDLVGSWPDDLFLTGPGSLNDFLDENVFGPWTLTVSDEAYGATGRLNSWGLDLLVTPMVAAGAGDDRPRATRLVGNAPNPFNPRTTMHFELADAGRVRLAVYDLRGRMVTGLADGPYPAGRHEIVWNGETRFGDPAPSGIYFVRLETDHGRSVLKTTLVR